MCRSASSLVAAFVLAVPASAAQVQLQTAGAVESGPPHVQIRVDLANLANSPARGVTIEAELLGRRQLSRLEDDLPGLSGGSATFAFDVGALPPGVYPLALHVQYERSAVPGDLASQRGYLLLALGAAPRPPVTLSVPDVPLDTLATLAVRLESADLKAHRMRVRMLVPRGLQAYGPDAEVSVPQFGPAVAELKLLRGGAPRPSQQGLVVIAETIDEEPANASAATVLVDVQKDPAWMPRLRGVFLALAGLLIAAAAYAEKRRRDGRERGQEAENPPAST